MSCDGLEVEAEAEDDGLGGGVLRVMDLGLCVSCDGFGVSQSLEVVCQEDVM